MVVCLSVSGWHDATGRACSIVVTFSVLRFAAREHLRGQVAELENPIALSASGKFGAWGLAAASFQMTVVQGIVAQYLMNPDGFVDGLPLPNNTIIRFPPHLGQVLTQSVSPQDVVRVEGFFESPGTFHASSIVDLQSQRSVIDTPPSPRHPHSPRPGSVPRQQLSASGTIRVLTHGKRGEINGVVLSDGAIVHFAPPIEMQFGALLREGNQFAAIGYGTSNDFLETNLSA